MMRRISRGSRAGPYMENISSQNSRRNKGTAYRKRSCNSTFSSQIASYLSASLSTSALASLDPFARSFFSFRSTVFSFANWSFFSVVSSRRFKVRWSSECTSSSCLTSFFFALNEELAALRRLERVAGPERVCQRADVDCSIVAGFARALEVR